MSARLKRGSGAPAPSDNEATPACDVQALLEDERARQAAAQLAATQAALEALSVEHEALQAARRHEGQEAAEVAAHHRLLMAEKDAQLAAAQAGAAAAEARLAEAQAAAEQREAALAAAAAAEAALLQQAAAGLQAKLDGLAEFAAQRESLLAELQRLRAEKAAAAEEAGEKIRVLQRRLHEAEHRMDAGSSGAGDEDGDGGDALYAEGEVHRLLAHSRRAAAEMERYGQEAEALQREMKALEGERAGLLRDVALRQEMEAQYAKRGTLQAREIRSARTKITSLEKGLVRMAADFEQEKAALEQQLRAQLADAVAEQNSLRRLLQVRTRELRHVRRLAQQVLLQRSEVEAFLVSSIQLVRAQMAAEAAGAGAAAGAAAGATRVGLAPTAAADGGAGGASGDPLHQPELGGMAVTGASAGSNTDSSTPAGSCATCEGAGWTQQGSPLSCAAPSPTAAAVAATGTPAADIRTLSWQDRERVLRLLFAKINRAAAQPVARPAAEAAPLPPLRGPATEAGPAGLA